MGELLMVKTLLDYGSDVQALTEVSTLRMCMMVVFYSKKLDGVSIYLFQSGVYRSAGVVSKL